MSATFFSDVLKLIGALKGRKPAHRPYLDIDNIMLVVKNTNDTELYLLFLNKTVLDLRSHLMVLSDDATEDVIVIRTNLEVSKQSVTVSTQHRTGS